MEYKRVQPDKALMEVTATPDVLAVVFGGGYEICVIAGIEDGKLICYAVFSHIPGKNRDVNLEYLYTIPERREEGACTGLLIRCESYLASRGVHAILSRMALRPPRAQEFNSFLTGRGFVPLCLTGRMLHYRLADMLDAGAIQMILKNRDKLPPVRDLKGIGEQHVNALLARQRETGFFFYKEECEEACSRFYFEDGSIHGAMIASRPQDDTLYISAIYMDALAQKRNIFLVLFCSCVEPLLDDVEEEDVQILIALQDETTYDGLMRAFNPPEKEYLVVEHMKPLKAVKGTH